MFIVSLTYTCVIDDIEKYLPAHIEYLDRHYSTGTFLVSGRKNPRTGGVILAVTESREELDNILAEDPFHINKLADYDVIEFTPTKASEKFSFLVE